MKKEKFLTHEQEQNISKLISSFEKKTRSELSVVISHSSSFYTTATMRVAIILTFILSFLFSVFYQINEERLLIVAMFGLFILCYKLGTTLFFKRLFLTENEMANKVDHRAFQIFHQWIKPKTSHQKNTMLYISLFERKLDLLFDNDINKVLSKDEAQKLVASLSLHFKQEHFFDGLVELIESLETKLEKKLGENTSPLISEHQDLIIWSEDLPHLY